MIQRTSNPMIGLRKSELLMRRHPSPMIGTMWRVKRISNPEYKGVWEVKKIDNPEFEDDNEVYKYADFGFIGFDLWQVKSGTIFDNVIITDDKAEADTFAAKWKSLNAIEVAKKKEEDEAKKAEDAKKDEDDDDDDDDEDDKEEM